MIDPAIAPERLHGTWRLVGSRATDAAGRPLPPPWGPEPIGRLVLARNGRMIAMLCDGRADLPAGVARAYSSYCGAYRVEGDTLTTLVDGAVDPARIGGAQVRRLAMEGERLLLMPPRGADGAQRVLIWERDESTGLESMS